MTTDSAPCKKRKPAGPLYVIEHMEEGLEEWCRLEYCHVCSFLPSDQILFLRFPDELNAASLAPTGNPPPRSSPECLERAGAASLIPSWDRVCLMDMQAEEALQPEDFHKFDAVVFGGILGNVFEQDDGSYGSDDRTSELRKLGFANRRHLGPMQMTTDTAVLVSRMVLEEERSLADIPWLDSPDIGNSTAESTGVGTASKEDREESGPGECVCMEGFRYVARRGVDGDWEPTLPEGMRELLMRSADDDILGSL